MFTKIMCTILQYHFNVCRKISALSARLVMGVPAFFRWLSKKYPSIVVECDDGVKGKAHFDNLYLDMNGIIHPCSHPEYKAAPETEEEMFVAIFEYIERIMTIVKPKKLLYMAVDGCAPRAKMNQQRSRRFRASQDNALRQWIDEKLSADNEDRDGLWPKDMVVILSDASVPGEGEHKIMEYIRKQKAQSATYDADLSHCLYGADADLIMLGLATHELNFTILREEFKPNQPKPCDICNQLGHDMKECLGTERPPDDMEALLPQEPEFIYIRLCVLREYLAKECSGCAVHLDLERFIDDFVFLCFFVGNDFLPHLPSLEIRENAIDRLISIHKENATKYPNPDNPYLTKDGSVFMERVQYVLQELGTAEDEIFKARQENEIRFKERRKRQKLHTFNLNNRWARPEAVGGRGSRPQAFDNTRNEAYQMRMTPNVLLNSRRLRVSAALTATFVTVEVVAAEKAPEDSDSDPEDLVQLYTEGWKERYYNHKFDCTSTTVEEISSMVAREYIIGLSWVLLYYYQGCPDWKWFYPFHYAPFASDFKNIASVEVKFDRKALPFNPLEQLMSVFPAASSQNLPPTWRRLMSDQQSSIIDFYPNTFKIDLNGKKAAWMGVALLPFIDESRLFNALKKVYSNLTEEERERNARGNHLIFVAKIESDFSDFSKQVVESSAQMDVPINPELFRGIAGTLAKSESFTSRYKRVYCAVYKDPVYDPDFVFPAIRLSNAKAPEVVLRPEDLEKLERYNWRPTIGMRRHDQKAHVSEGGMRMFSHSFSREHSSYGNQYHRNSDDNFGQYQNPYNRQHLARDQQQQQQGYNSYYRAPDSYRSNQNNYRSSQSSQQNSYRTSDQSQYPRNDYQRQQNRGNDNWRQSNQPSNSYQSNQSSYGSQYNQRNTNAYQSYDGNGRNPRQQRPYDQQQRNYPQTPYYGANTNQNNRREDPWNRRQ
ncbi:unnamed protein product [Medioppia subpectinata]|uniref:5'-3' exoribonuclease n=1 Tax=Medioppia subpectinata TaxID=1979941 RepID=A0A7R9KN54_9ACAR|nr:unnamed protein product [Medioppia subpectinata]CAG2106329.1 unnamed protein product [Medioppia subpectinata]